MRRRKTKKKDKNNKKSKKKQKKKNNTKKGTGRGEREEGVISRYKDVNIGNANCRKLLFVVVGFCDENSRMKSPTSIFVLLLIHQLLFAFTHGLTFTRKPTTKSATTPKPRGFFQIMTLTKQFHLLWFLSRIVLYSSSYVIIIRLLLC